jgi:hypothetical protein
VGAGDGPIVGRDQLEGLHGGRVCRPDTRGVSGINLKLWRCGRMRKILCLSMKNTIVEAPSLPCPEALISDILHGVCDDFFTGPP